MSWLLWRASDELGVVAPRQVLRADEVGAFDSVQALAQHLQAQQAQAASRLDEALAEAAARGLVQGQAAGRAAAAEALAAQLAALQAQLDDALQAQRDEVAALALALARKLVGDMPDPARSLRLAAEGARELRPAQVLRVQVPATLAPALAAALAAQADARHPLAQAEVVADAQLAEGECRLVTDCGRADASLAARLARIEALWQDAAAEDR